MIHAVVHLLGGAMLFCSFLVLSQRRFAAMIALYRVTAGALAAAALFEGYVQSAPGWYFIGGVTLAIKVILLPMVLQRKAWRFGAVRDVVLAGPPGVLMILGLVVIGLAALVVPLATVPTASLTREDLVIALCIVLLGFLIMAMSRNALGQLIGFLFAENGLMLAAILMPGMPFVAWLLVALLVLLGGMLLLGPGVPSAALDLRGR